MRCATSTSKMMLKMDATFRLIPIFFTFTARLRLCCRSRRTKRGPAHLHSFSVPSDPTDLIVLDFRRLPVRWQGVRSQVYSYHGRKLPPIPFPQFVEAARAEEYLADPRSGVAGAHHSKLSTAWIICSCWCSRTIMPEAWARITRLISCCRCTSLEPSGRVASCRFSAAGGEECTIRRRNGIRLRGRLQPAAWRASRRSSA